MSASTCAICAYSSAAAPRYFTPKDVGIFEGDPTELYTLALQLAETLPLTPENVSKAERGYRAYLDAPVKPWRAKPAGGGFPHWEHPPRTASGMEPAARLLAIVSRAVHHAHQKGVAHGSLKPGNVLVHWNGEGQPVFKVTDFGFAHAMGTILISPGGMQRTPAAYLPPEQASGGNAKPSLDVYAAGLIAFETFTGGLVAPESDDNP